MHARFWHRHRGHTYITPIYEAALASDNRDNDLAILNGMKAMLGTGGNHTELGFSSSSWCMSCGIVNASDYQFDQTNLNYVVQDNRGICLPPVVEGHLAKMSKSAFGKAMRSRPTVMAQRIMHGAMASPCLSFYLFTSL